MPNCTPSLIASQSRNPRRRTATPVVSLNRARPNMGHTWTPNCPTYFLPIPKGKIADLLLRLTLGVTFCLQVNAQVPRTCYRVADVATPEGIAPEVSAVDFTPAGDLVLCFRRGYIYIRDRVKDMIVSGGENVYPNVIENLLFQHPSVADVAVIGVPDERWGESVKAVVVLRDGASATDEEIMDFCRGKLGGFERPRSVDFIDALPSTTVALVS